MVNQKDIVPETNKLNSSSSHRIQMWSELSKGPFDYSKIKKILRTDDSRETWAGASVSTQDTNKWKIPREQDQSSKKN